MYCTKCGEDLSAVKGPFCSTCGTKISGVTTTASNTPASIKMPAKKTMYLLIALSLVVWAVIAMAFQFGSSGSEGDALVGLWRNKFGPGHYYEFFSNGTMTSTYNGTIMRTSNWSVNGNILQLFGSEHTFSINRGGGELRINRSDGSFLLFVPVTRRG